MKIDTENRDEALPGEGLDFSKMPGHWLLAQMGKRVLRPGGLELTRRMLATLDIQASDEVVEFAPGLGLTARAALERNPASYTGVERDEKATRLVRRYLNGPGRQCLVGKAESTGLPASSATVVFGEAMLSMQTAGHKEAIVKEADFRDAVGVSHLFRAHWWNHHRRRENGRELRPPLPVSDRIPPGIALGQWLQPGGESSAPRCRVGQVRVRAPRPPAPRYDSGVGPPRRRF